MAADYTPPRIFIADDSELFITSIERILTEHNHFSICGKAMTGVDALSSIENAAPDVAIIDIQMPGKSGTELIGDIRSLKLSVKILAVSVCEDGATVAGALKAGANGYLSKLRGIEHLLSVIEKILKEESYFTDAAIIIAKH